MSDYPKEITEALHQVMTKVGYVQKKGVNQFHKYRYAGEADLLEALRPAMLEAGLILIPSATDYAPVDQYGNTFVKVEYTLAHKSGKVWPDKIGAVGCGNDKNSKGGVQDKGIYKALTGANKYLLFKLFQIETGDDPENAEGVAPPPGQGRASGHATQARATPTPEASPKARTSEVHLYLTGDGKAGPYKTLTDYFNAFFEEMELSDPVELWKLNSEVAQKIARAKPSWQPRVSNLEQMAIKAGYTLEAA